LFRLEKQKNVKRCFIKIARQKSANHAARKGQQRTHSQQVPQKSYGKGNLNRAQRPEKYGRNYVYGVLHWRCLATPAENQAYCAVNVPIATTSAMVTNLFVPCIDFPPFNPRF
jgi:hypothetical protein